MKVIGQMIVVMITTFALSVAAKKYSAYSDSDERTSLLGSDGTSC
jgi:hypothetical protein